MAGGEGGRLSQINDRGRAQVSIRFRVRNIDEDRDPDWLAKWI